MKELTGKARVDAFRRLRKLERSFNIAQLRKDWAEMHGIQVKMDELNKHLAVGAVKPSI